MFHLFKGSIFREAEVGCEGVERGKGTVVGATVGRLKRLAKIFCATPVGEGAEASWNRGDVWRRVELEEVALGEVLGGVRGGGFRKDDASEAKEEQGVRGHRIGKEAERSGKMFAGACPVFARAVKGEVLLAGGEEGEAFFVEEFAEGNGKGVCGQLGGVDGVGVEELCDACGVEGGHLEADVVGGIAGALDVGIECAGCDGKGLDLAELGVVASATEASAHVEGFEPRHPELVPPCITTTALRTESAVDSFREARGVDLFAHPD